MQTRMYWDKSRQMWMVEVLGAGILAKGGPTPVLDGWSETVPMSSFMQLPAVKAACRIYLERAMQGAYDYWPEGLNGDVPVQERARD